MKTFSFIGIFILFATNSFAMEREEFRALLNSKEFDCNWISGKPTVGVVNSDKVCIGWVECKYMPASNSSTPEKDRKDYKIVSGCKANDDGTCADKPKDCEYRNDTEMPNVHTRAGFLSSEDTKKQKDDELGECEYENTGGRATGAVIQRAKNFDLVCASPLKCTGGTVKPSIPLAICDYDDVKILKLKNPKTGAMEDNYYPICPSPITCLKRGEKDGYKFEMATVSRKDARNSTAATKGVPHAKSKLIEQFADISSRPTPGKLPELPHI